MAHALLTRLAEIEGVRILFIKGPTAVQMGARPPRPTSDVDLLCEPGGMARLGTALESCGWRRRDAQSAKPQFKYAAKYLFDHSHHYIHDEWPCDLDIHYNFPGFFAPPDVVFDALWNRRSTAEVAHWRVPCADFVGQAAIVGLHALRDPGVARNELDLDHLETRLRQIGAGDDLTDLAEITGASETLKPLLARADGRAPHPEWSDPEQLDQWRVRTRSAVTDASYVATTWLLELLEAPWRARVSIARRAVFPPRSTLVKAETNQEVTTIDFAKLYLRRWWLVIHHSRRALIWASRRRSR